MEQSGAKGPFFLQYSWGVGALATINYCSAFPHPILLHLNEMTCPRSPLYNDTKFTLISVQIRPKSDQYEQI